jgi:hypothetical protein
MKEYELVEQRWPAILVILFMLLLLEALPDSLRFFPRWVPYTIALSPIVAMVALMRAQSTVWLRIERVVVAVFFLMYGATLLIQLTVLMNAMLRHPSDVSGVQLLASSLAVWSSSIVMFSLIYWRIDRGGPEARVNKRKVPPDWRFPIEGSSAMPPNWSPTYIDYLFLAFTTATSFSPTEAMPFTHRAKLLMMLQGLISLVTILAVAARAINILGS